MTQKIYLIGICGVGMATLAVMLKNKNYHISGSDENVFPPMSDYLAKNNIPIYVPYNKKNLKNNLDLVIIGNSISRGNQEVEFLLNEKIPYISMAEAIKTFFLKDNFPLVVTGTHGKTTITSLISYLLVKLKEPIGFFIGAASREFSTYGKHCKNSKEIFVIEGDEYDTSFFDKKSKFFHYFPHYLVINNIELDHVDIFQDEAEIVRNFHYLVRMVPSKGAIFANYDDTNVRKVIKNIHTNLISFGKSKNANYRISNIKFSANQSTFLLKNENFFWEITTPLLGLMNVYNSCAAILCCLQLGYKMCDIQKYLLEFKNAKRRLELLTIQKNCIVYDDFAHHPTAIEQNIITIRNIYPKRKIFVIYEPRSNTSIQKTFESNLAQSFLKANFIVFFKNKKLLNLPKKKKIDLNIVCQNLKKIKKTALQFTDNKKLKTFLKSSIEPNSVFLFLSQSHLDKIPQDIATFADEKYQ